MQHRGAALVARAEGGVARDNVRDFALDVVAEGPERRRAARARELVDALVRVELCAELDQELHHLRRRVLERVHHQRPRHQVHIIVVPVAREEVLVPSVHLPRAVPCNSVGTLVQWYSTSTLRGA